jgi:aromatic ring-cleaving dioxygenase
MSDESLAEPVQTRTIRSYHAHIYWSTDQQRAAALRVREQLAARFSVQLGRIHEVPVGPHPIAMYQVAFSTEVFAQLTPWLMLNRLGLSVLVHPNTGRARDDHERHPLWLGAPLELLTETLPNEPGTDGISEIVVNTSPTLPAE